MSEKIIEQTFRQKTKRFFEPVKYNKVVTIKLLFYFFIEILIGVLFIFFIRDITRVLEQGDKNFFYSTLVWYMVVFIVLFVLLLIIKDFWTLSYNRYRKFVEEKYIPLYITWDNNAHEKVWTGKSIAIISKGIKSWGGLLDNTMIEILRFITSASITLYFLLQIHAYLWILLIFLLLLWQSLGFYVNSLVSNIRQNRIELDNIWSKRLAKVLMSKMEILQTTKTSQEVEVLHELHEWQIYWNKKMATFLVPFFSIGNIIVLTLLYSLFFYFWDGYFSWEIELASIAALTGAVLMMQKDFIWLLDFLKNFWREFAEVQNMWNFFDTTPQIIWYEDGKDFVHKDGRIVIQNMSYSYEASQPIFQDFDLKIPGNKITALVGPSGWGKSTLVKLISGYIKQDSGDILIDRQNLKEVSLKSYYADVWYLTQEPSVFDGTIEENLLYAVRKKPTKKKIQEIITLANCEFIYDLKDGLETEIGERGVKLSGWQKQRLAIAKIFLKNPKIIILDEPTSALDSMSEKKITQAMHNLFKNRTVIIIAHRLQTVKHADDIIVIDSWSVVERGTHDLLVKKNWYYKQMLDLQSWF